MSTELADAKLADVVLVLEHAIGKGFVVDRSPRGGRTLVRCARGCKGHWQVIRWPLSTSLRLALLGHLAWHVRRGDVS